jgi:transmembrane sensor
MNTTNPNAVPVDEYPIDEGQAEAWLARLLSPHCRPEDRAAFEDWLAQSPDHVDAYLEAELVHATAGKLASDDLLRAAARQARRRMGEAGARRGRWFSAISGIAATLAIALGAAYWLTRAPVVTVEQYATAVGEQRTVVLSDGTAMLLDTGSSVTTRFSDRERRVVMERGRVQFSVGRDPRRPFLVQAGPGTVRDIGTTFQVSRTGEEVTVGLIEGAVEVAVGEDASTASRSTLAPGEQVAIDAKGALQVKRPLDLAVAQAWPRGDLVFKERRLDQLLAEMNRYSQTQVRLADPELGALTVSGVFHIDDQQALVTALERGWSLRAERVGDHEIVLHR